MNHSSSSSDSSDNEDLLFPGHSSPRLRWSRSALTYELRERLNTSDVTTLGSGNHALVFSVPRSSLASLQLPDATAGIDEESKLRKRCERVAVKIFPATCAGAIAEVCTLRTLTESLPTSAPACFTPRLIYFNADFLRSDDKTKAESHDVESSISSCSESESCVCKPKQECAMLVMDELGPDVFELTERYRLTHDEILVCGIAMLDALTWLHNTSGMAHKSVKPENFCFPRDFRDENEPLLRIIDFGRASIANDDIPAPFEEPYSGWWHGFAGLVGAPQLQVDDLLSLIYSIGFLLSDIEGSDDRGAEFIAQRKRTVREFSAARRVAIELVMRSGGVRHMLQTLETSAGPVVLARFREWVAAQVALETLHQVAQSRLCDVENSEGSAADMMVTHLGTLTLPSWYLQLLSRTEVFILLQLETRLLSRIQSSSSFLEVNGIVVPPLPVPQSHFKTSDHQSVDLVGIIRSTLSKCLEFAEADQQSLRHSILKLVRRFTASRRKCEKKKRRQREDNSTQ